MRRIIREGRVVTARRRRQGSGGDRLGLVGSRPSGASERQLPTRRLCAGCFGRGAVELERPWWSLRTRITTPCVFC